MDSQTEKSQVITVTPGYDPVIAPLVWMLQDTRERTITLLDNISAEALEWTPDEGGNSVGSILYHLVAIELSYLYEDIQGIGWTDELGALLPYEVRDDDGRLTVVHGEYLEDHLNRLESSRARLISVLKDMSREDVRRQRKVGKREVSPEWVIHHLMQHEAEHRGQIWELLRMFDLMKIVRYFPPLDQYRSKCIEYDAFLIPG